jgi:uncharacterized protein involved in type VI secretion and phage assembly
MTDHRTAAPLRGKPLHGLYNGVVTDNADPQQLGRVRVSFPALPALASGIWARLSTLAAGADSGTWFVPAVGDEVVVAFMNGQADAPVVLGSMWSGTNRPPVVESAPSDVKLIRSRSGSTIEIDERHGNSTITLETGGGHRIHMDDASGVVTIRGASGDEIEIGSSGIRIVASAKVTVMASMVNVESPLTKFNGVVQVGTLIADSVVSASYSPGAGNIM